MKMEDFKLVLKFYDKGSEMGGAKSQYPEIEVNVLQLSLENNESSVWMRTIFNGQVFEWNRKMIFITLYRVVYDGLIDIGNRISVWAINNGIDLDDSKLTLDDYIDKMKVKQSKVMPGDDVSSKTSNHFMTAQQARYRAYMGNEEIEELLMKQIIEACDRHECKINDIILNDACVLKLINAGYVVKLRVDCADDMYSIGW